MTKTRKRLTAAQVKSAKLKTGRHSDGDRLYLRVRDDGRRRWEFIYEFAGKQRTKDLGLAIGKDAVSLAEARAKAAEGNIRLAQGLDPLETIWAKTKPSTVPAFGAVARELHEALSPGWKSKTHRHDWLATLERHAKALMARPVDTIAADDVRAALLPLWKTAPETGSRVRARIEAVVDAARVRGHIPADRANPARWKGNFDKLLPSPHGLGKRARARQRGEKGTEERDATALVPRGNHPAISHSEMPALMADLRALDSIAARALEFCILTCSRTGEVLGALWKEINVDAGLWTLPPERLKQGGKIKQPHVVPLSDRCLEILREMSKVRVNRLVFPGPGRAGALGENTLSTTLRTLTTAGTVHGMRSSARSWMAASGVAFDVAEACLGHAVGDKTTRAYQRDPLVERRKAVMSAWADFLGAGGSENVVALDTAIRRSA